VRAENVRLGEEPLFAGNDDPFYTLHISINMVLMDNIWSSINIKVVFRRSDAPGKAA
jgi:hypothetical protein